MSTPVLYHLNAFPPQTLLWEQLIPLIGRANAGLARYDGLLSAIPNASVLLSPLTTQEAVLSSRIEGTQATMGEVLELEAGGEPTGLSEPKLGDVEEILNYRHAMHRAVQALEELPLSQRLLKDTHATLLRGVRGQSSDPGNYRRIENWIGPKRCSRDEASFVPIGPELLSDAMGRWERYLHEEALDALVQLAIVHVEFEALHPFLDGNGRLGRMLIPLFLFDKKLLSGPHFYVSAYFEAHREEYYERLRRVSSHGDWTGWCAFFLRALSEQALENERKARSILSLYASVKTQMVKITHSQHSVRATDFLFEMPIFNAPDFMAKSEIPKATAMRILSLLRNEGLLGTLREGKGGRSGIFAFRQLLNIAEGREVI